MRVWPGLYLLSLLALGGGSLQATPINCSSVTTWGGLEALPTTGSDAGCINQDKIYSNFVGTIPLGWSDFITVDTVDGTDFHSIQLTRGGSAALLPGTYSVGYTISIDPTSPTFATEFITQAEISADINPNSVDSLVSASFSDGITSTLIGTISTGGSSSLVTDNKSLLVSETLKVGSKSAIRDFTTTFVETSTTVVPEAPANALTGLGLIALAALGRKLKRCR